MPNSRQIQRRLTAAEQVSLVQRYQAGSKMNELAAEFGVHRTTVSACLKRLAIPLRQPGLHGEDIAEAARLYEQGWSLARLGDKFDCHLTEVHRKLVAHGVKMRPRPGWKY